MKNFERVLITGTTSGLGQAFLDHYHGRGKQVISVNRRAAESQRQKYPNQIFEELDITNAKVVQEFLESLQSKNLLPDLFILSAGINRQDNVGRFDLKSFDEVMNINLRGVLTFVSAIQVLKLTDRVILGMSSTSNIVPNPGHMSYHVSKWAIWRLFDLLRQNDTHNTYKTVVLGPVLTNIMSGYPKPGGLQGKLFNFMAVSASQATRDCARFIEGSSKTFYYPQWVYLFYLAVKTILGFLPSLYKGSR